MILLNIFIIAFLAVFIIDYSGIVDEADKVLTKVFKSRVPLHIPKPFSCSLCSTFWASIIYLLIIHQLSFVTLLYTGLACALTPEILSIIYFIKDLINKIFITLEEFLKIR